MLLNWKRFTLGVFLLASLSLLLFGCGDFSGSQSGQKAVSGVVSDPATGLALADAKVTVYAIDANGVKSGTPLSTPASVQSDHKGRYQLLIPADYQGALMVEATKSAGPVAQLAKLLNLAAAGDIEIRALVPQNLVARPSIPPVMVSFATNMVLQYLNGSNAPLSSENIRKASIVLETFFGANFSQIPPLAGPADDSSTRAQQDLIVSIRAINSSTGGSPAAAAAVATALHQAGGIGSVADDIKSGIAAAITALAAQGLLPPEYAPSQAINTAISNAQFARVPEPELSDSSAPAAPAGVALAALSAKSVTLTWSAAPDADLAGYLVYRADASGVYLCVGGVDRSGTGFSDLTARPATAYSYQVAAFDQSRNLSAASNTVTVTTPAAADLIAPGAPAGLVSPGASHSQVNLKWLQSIKTRADGSVLPAARYHVYRDAQLIAVTSETSYIDFGVSPSSSYRYWVKASDQDANLSPASQTLMLRTGQAPGAQLPQAPTGLVVTPGALRHDSTPLTWNASASAASQSVSYNVYRDGVLIATGILATRYHDDSVTPSTSYLYAVTALAGTAESEGVQLSVAIPANPELSDPQAPTVPANLSVVSAASNSVALVWSASTKSGGDRVVAGYDVLRGDGAGNNYVKVATVSQPAYTDTNNVAPSTAYSYMVRSFSSAGVRSAASLPAGVQTPARIDLSDRTKPSAPGNLALGSEPRSDAVSLTWTAATKANADASHFVAGYLVYRDGAQIADAYNLLYFTDSTIQGSTSYSYSVRAYDNSGNLSEPSDPLQVTTPAAVPNSYTISGRVTLNGVGLYGVVLENGVGNPVVTDVNGNYSFTGVAAGNYTVTPQPTEFYRFTPAQRSVSVSGPRPGLDFAATLTGVVNGGLGFPSGTVIGGISIPAGTVIGGVTYPAGTIVGGVFYPTGTVIGGITYPNGVVIGGVSYPPGTIVGGIAFPVGAVTSGVGYPSGTVIGGVVYPSGSVAVIAGLPTGVVIGGVTYPAGTVVGGISFPSGTVIGGVAYPAGTIVAGVFYPSGAVIGGVRYPDGVVIGGVSYPPGTVVGGISLPPGAVAAGVSYPSGTVSGTVSYPSGALSGAVTLPGGGAAATAQFPTGVVLGGVTYPSGTVSGGVLFPSGAVTGGVSYPAGSVTGGVIYPYGGVLSDVAYGSAAISGLLDYRYLVSGNVSHTGGVLAGAAISVAGTPYSATSDALGNYRLYLPAGSYTISAQFTGYSFPDAGPVTLDGASQSASADFFGSAGP